MADQRETPARRRWVPLLLLIGLPAAITIAWLGYVVAGGWWDRVTSNWASSLTMVFGSFVAGSTPQGGGAVAFPVFTKGLETPAAVARTFSLSIQAVGMVTASLAILLSRKRIEGRAVATGGLAGIVGFLIGLLVLADPATPFWQSRLPEPYVKVTFTVVLAGMAYIVNLALRERDCGEPRIAGWSRRVWAGMILAGLIGGLATALLGSGVDVFVFLFIVIIAGLHPRVGVPTSVLAMAMVSMAGLIVLGVVHGQLDITLAGDQVVAVSGETLGQPLPAREHDVFGLWLAAIPIVVWGAPLGTVFVHWLQESRLVLFLAAMAALEVVSTALFLPDLRTNPALLLFGVVGLVCAIALVRKLHDEQQRLLPAVAPQPVRR